jgi:hypothetical protein
VLKRFSDTVIGETIRKNAADAYLLKELRAKQHITRGELMRAIVLAMGWRTSVKIPESFRDVGKNYWYGDSIKTAQEYEVICGYPDKTFRPKELVTRAELAKIMARVLKMGKTSDYAVDTGGSWAKDYINACIEMRVMDTYSGDRFVGNQYANNIDINQAIRELLLILERRTRANILALKPYI